MKMRNIYWCLSTLLSSLLQYQVWALEKETTNKLLEIAKARGLSSEDILSAASTYTPRNGKDEFICLNSGGQAGSVIAYAVPSMRILKYIPTSAPDSSNGYNFDVQSRTILEQGHIEGQEITWGDTHHPAFSETDGEYDGRYAFINDKANPRIFVIDLRDFETKQIVSNPIFRSSHGGAFLTPNSEYVIEGSQYAAPPDRKYYPLNDESFNKHYRGGITFHKFDRDKGRILPEKSFTVIAPPYSQDLSDAGKGESDGFSFTNSFCAERYVTGFEEGRPPYEAGCSSRDTDYLHIINWKRAEQVVKEGKTTKINGHTVIPLETAAAEGVLFLIPEPKSPHGADVSPDGRFIVVAGKLDTHATVFDIRKIKELISKKEFVDKDPYGVPILDMKKSIHGQIELGLGPLHTQFGANGDAYTSLYIDSQVAKWDYANLKVLDKVSVQYNIGHLVSMQGDSVDPRGKYVIALNKLSIDRFNGVGPLHPQNHQLIDTSGDKMRVLYDLPLPLGEPHYTVCIDANKVKPITVYEPGTDSNTMQPSPLATSPGKERIKRTGKKVEVYATIGNHGVTPSTIEAKQGDTIVFHLTNIEREAGRSMRFNVNGYNALGVLAPGRVASVEFIATQAGWFNYRGRGVDDANESRRFGLLMITPSSPYEGARIARYNKEQRHRKALMEPPKLADVKVEMAEGQAEFENYSCGGCHVRGIEKGGPDLTDVTKRRTPEWITKWILNPAAYYDDPTIVPLIKRYGVKMPNQNVKPADAEKIVRYLATWKSSPPVAEASASTAPVPKAYGEICFACHAQGVGGAPKTGDKEAWGPRLSQGEETLFKHALTGYQGKTGYMPPKGTCMECTDEEIKEAVRYMKDQVQ
jgi:nitrous-oxide reductase